MKPTTPPIPTALTLGLALEAVGIVTSGWSVKREILNNTVYNDDNESIGTIEDLILSRGKSISHAIIGVGSYLGVEQHEVAVPVKRLRIKKAQITLPGATAENLKTLHAFEYE